MKAFELGEVADLMVVDARTVQEWIRTGQLVAFTASRSRTSKKPRYRILESDLQRFIDSRKTCEQSQRPSRRKKLPPVPNYV